MPITYAELTNSQIKLATLLFGLSFPNKPTAEYWQKWFNEPLHQYVFIVVKALTEHRQRIMRLHHEQEFTQQQLQELSNQLLTHEDQEQIRKFLHQEYINLLRAEKRELNNQLQFLEQQKKVVDNDLATLAESQHKEWNLLLKEQMKILKKELKKQNLTDLLKKLQDEYKL